MRRCNPPYARGASSAAASATGVPDGCELLSVVLAREAERSFGVQVSRENYSVLSVELGSPAHRAGLKAGDQIWRLDGKPIGEVPLYQTLYVDHAPPLDTSPRGFALTNRARSMALVVLRGVPRHGSISLGRIEMTADL